MGFREQEEWQRPAFTGSREIEPQEAEECFFHDYVFARDERRFDDVYVLDEKTDRGRWLLLVLQDKGKGLVRIFTGWELKSRKQKNK